VENEFDHERKKTKKNHKKTTRPKIEPICSFAARLCDVHNDGPGKMPGSHGMILATWNLSSFLHVSSAKTVVNHP
jgi:hypothetical protein